MAVMRVGLGLMVAAAALGAALVGPATAPAFAAPAAKPAGRVYRMTSLLAYEPVWLGDSKRLAFFGNRQQGEPAHVYVWEPLNGKLGRATTTLTKRHSLAASESGRLAYAEHYDKAAGATPSNPAQPAPGPDVLVVQDLQTHTRQVVMADAWIMPGSVAWSPDGKRLAFITIDGEGKQRLAIVTPGQPVALVQLAQPYELQALVGWANDREVLLRGAPIVNFAAGPERLLLVGREGVQSYRSALDPKLSPDGRWLLAKHSEAGGVALRLVSGGSRVLSASATGYDWAPEADRVYASVDRDVLALDLKGRVLKRWNGLASLALGQVTVSPDGKLLAFGADYGLAVLPLK
jgi:Tol biopolymer transport system component